MRYASVLIERGFFDERPVRRVRDAVVEIGPRTILIEWREGARPYRYEGVRSGQGHFLLRSDDGAGKATLHRFQYSDVLEGFWERNRNNGFWRVHLPRERQPKLDRLAVGLRSRRGRAAGAA